MFATVVLEKKKEKKPAQEYLPKHFFKYPQKYFWSIKFCLVALLSSWSMKIRCTYSQSLSVLLKTNFSQT